MTEVKLPAIPSPKYSLNKTDLARIGLGAGIALGGALLTYLAGVIPNVDFGVWTPIVTAVFAILVNTGRKYLKDYTK